MGAFRAAVEKARRQSNLVFAAQLSEDRIHLAFGSARGKWQGWVYSPAVTVWTFLSQSRRKPTSGWRLYLAPRSTVG